MAWYAKFGSIEGGSTNTTQDPDRIVFNETEARGGGEDGGTMGILAREYDLIRNMDFRIDAIEFDLGTDSPPEHGMDDLRGGEARDQFEFVSVDPMLGLAVVSGDSEFDFFM